MWKVILILILLIFIYFYVNQDEYESFENKMHNSYDQFDKQYVDLFSFIFDFNTIHQKEMDLFKKNDIVFKGNVLDAGCGTGALSNLIYEENKKNNVNSDLVCVDKSKSFLKKAEMNNIYNRYILGNLENSELFENKSFDIIISDYDGFYYNNHRQMNDILKNYYLWLKDGGFVVFYFLNNEYLDPSPRDYSMYYFDTKKNKHSMTYFDGFYHNSWFMENSLEKDSYLFYEKIMLQKSGHVRIKKTAYVIPPKDAMVSMIEKNGFKIKSILNFDDDNEYEIFILYK